MKYVLMAYLASALCTTVQTLKTNIFLPLYVYPNPGAWNSIYKAIAEYPTLEFQIVINPSSGPGSSSVIGHDDNWTNATSTLNSYNNVRTFGYVHTLDGNETIENLEANITTWASWNAYINANISMHGVFFDETPDNDTTYMQSLTDFAHSKLGSNSQIIFNPGKVVSDELYFSMADHVIVSEVTADRYSTSVPTNSVSSQHASRASILVYELGRNGTSSGLETWLGGMVKAGIGNVNVVDYGWDASNAGDSPADVGTVAQLLVEAGAISRRARGVYVGVISSAVAFAMVVCR